MFLHALVVIFGLCLFEIITSVDNAIINANILKTLGDKYRRFFLFWGILFAVFVVRGLLPFAIIWLAAPGLSLSEVFTVAFSNNGEVTTYLSSSRPLLLMGGGIYLFFVFLAWLFLENKNFAFKIEKFLKGKVKTFYLLLVASIVLIAFLSYQHNINMLIAAIIGLVVFIGVSALKKHAERTGRKLLNPAASAWSKIIYLEVLDASFSVDGVIGAFAFTMSVPFIIIGNGLGAVAVRQLTVKGINVISKFIYLKNGAMYSIGILGLIMTSESFGVEYPFWLTPLATVVLLSLFYGYSVKARRLKLNEEKKL
ncbi:MAG: DUF475 domain-containing protein [Patescibacteria group bacterium]|nr:DUF475 domain-containing protein [Patescibacteria group bacterium]